MPTTWTKTFAPYALPLPQRVQQNQTCSNSLEDRLGRYADNTDYAAKGLALGAALTSETGIGSAVLGGAALGAEISSFGLSAAKFGVQLYHGNRLGAAATLAGVGAGFLVPKGWLGISKFNQKFGGAAAGRFGEALADAQGVPASKLAEGVVGGVSMMLTGPILDFLLLAAGMIIFEKAIFFQVSILLSISGRSRFSREEMLNMFPSQLSLSPRMILFVVYLVCGMAFLERLTTPTLGGILFAASALAIIAWDIYLFQRRMSR